MSPTVMKIGPFRFYFYSNEGLEPPHIHVQDGKKSAKFWLESGELAYSVNFSAHELNKIKVLIKENKDTFMEAWHEFIKQRK